MGVCRWVGVGCAVLVACNAEGGARIGDTSQGQETEGDSGVSAQGGEVAPSDADVALETLPEFDEVTCQPSSVWHPGSVAFRERTIEWGLVDLAVLGGTRLSVSDLNGDGLPDLAARYGGTASDDFAAGGVRRQWLLLNEGGHFRDVTESSGVMARRTPGATARTGRPGEVWAFGDLDNDGDDDVYTGVSTNDVAKATGETSEVLVNDGHGHFTLGPSDGAIRRAGATDTVAGAAFLDHDRDGLLDLWVTQNGFATTTAFILQPSLLFRGGGHGAFSDVTIPVGLLTEDWRDLDELNAGEGHTRSWSALACDVNADGVPDLFSASYARAPNGFYQGFDNGGLVAFTNRSVVSGYAFDGDASFADNEFLHCYCTLHASDAVCAGLAAPNLTCPTPADANWTPVVDTAPFRTGGNSGTTVCADMDNDGDMDLITTELRHWWAGTGSDMSEILVNDGAPDPVFARPGRAAMGMVVPHDTNDWNEGHITAAAFDFDNDGWRDFYLGATDYPGNHGLLFHATGGGLHFESVPIAEGIDHHRSHGVVVADFDRDGDLDVVVGHSRGRCDPTESDDCYPTAQMRFFENVVGSAGNWLALALEGGAGTNRSAIGARVTVRTSETTQTFEVGGGHGHYGVQHERTVHAGLGGACTADVTVRWPDRALTTQTFRVVGGKRYHLRQGDAPVPLP